MSWVGAVRGEVAWEQGSGVWGNVPAPFLHRSLGVAEKIKFGERRVPPRDFPGGPVVKNPPANAGNKGLIPGPGRFRMPWSN